MANTIVRPASPVYRQLEFSPVYAPEVSFGVPATFASPPLAVDSINSGEIYLDPNIQEKRVVGREVDRQGGVLRAGIDRLGFDVRSYHFIRYAVRDIVGGSWGYTNALQSLTMQGGAYSGYPDTQDQIKLWGCKIDSLELIQEWSPDGSALEATATIMAVGGSPLSSSIPAVNPGTPGNKAWARKMSYHAAGMVMLARGDASPFANIPLGIRSYTLRIRNNLQYVTYGDLTANNVTGRGGAIIASNYGLREAYALREGEEEVEFEATIEVPLKWGDELYDFVMGDCYIPPTLSGSIVYTDPCAPAQSGAQVLSLTIGNLVIDTSDGMRYTYSAEDANGEPVHIYTIRAKKYDVRYPSVVIANV